MDYGARYEKALQHANYALDLLSAEDIQNATPDRATALVIAYHNVRGESSSGGPAVPTSVCRYKYNDFYSLATKFWMFLCIVVRFQLLNTFELLHFRNPP